MKIVYIAGPYRASSEYEVRENIRNAEVIAIEIWRRGHVALCPHKNTAFFGGICDDSFFLRGDLLLLSKCDALVCVPGWSDSEGASAEVDRAKALGIPVFITLNRLIEWLEGTSNERG